MLETIAGFLLLILLAALVAITVTGAIAFILTVWREFHGK